MRTLLHNARLILPDTLIEQGWLLIEGERILALGEGVASCDDAERVIDAQQALLLPGLIDLHCDSIEKVVEPRPNVFFDINFALQQVDWRLAAASRPNFTPSRWTMESSVCARIVLSTTSMLACRLRLNCSSATNCTCAWN